MNKTGKTFNNERSNGESVWFFVEKADGKKFLQWAKSIGCRWANGEEIHPEDGTDFFTVSMSKDGRIFNVPFFCYKVPKFKDVKRVNFKDVKINA